MTWFEVGIHLGQSSGSCNAFYDGFFKEGSCWSYRHREELLAILKGLGAMLEELSGIPDTDDPNVMNHFFESLPPDSPTIPRYPDRRWGWAFIEDQLHTLRDAAMPLPSAAGNTNEGRKPKADVGGRAGEIPDELTQDATNDRTLSANADKPPADLLHEFTPQAGKILCHLWNLKHALRWSSLPDGCRRIGDTSSQKKTGRLSRLWSVSAMG